MSVDPNLPPPPAAPAPAAPRRSLFARLGLGCLGLIVLSCVGIGGLFFYETWQQEQNYNAGHTAYMAADCATAQEPLGKAARGEPGTAESDVALKAQAELQECEELLNAEAAAATGDAGAAVTGFSAILTKYPASPLSAPALSQGQELISSAAPEALATAELCNTLDTLVEQNIINQPDAGMPGLLFACGQAAEAAGAYSEALAFYARFRDEYPTDARAEEVEAAFVRATLAEADAFGAGALPAPQAVGENTSDGFATVVIQNDSPEGLQMVFNGPDVRVEELEPCEECASFGDEEPEFCPEIGPVGTYTVAPGTYDVVVKASSDGSVTPFRGSWTLEAGQEYSSCFYLVTSE
jgi:hypothetical protein